MVGSRRAGYGCEALRQEGMHVIGEDEHSLESNDADTAEHLAEAGRAVTQTHCAHTRKPDQVGAARYGAIGAPAPRVESGGDAGQ